MVKEKHNKRKHNKPQIAALCILLVLSLVVGGTLAYMYSKSGTLDNRFKLAEVTCQVNVNDDKSFDVTNISDVDVYIRAAYVVNWMDTLGNVRGIPPETTEYTMTLNNTDWWLFTDGYYYYKYRVPYNKGVDSITKNLIESFGLATGITAPAGYELAVEVVAEAIQADGTTDTGDIPIVTEAWGVTVGADGNLTN